MSIQIKKTPARTAIKEYLSKTKIPVDVQSILIFLRSRNLDTNKVTVYRVLDFLYKNGFIDRVEFGEGKFRYEIKKNHHHHLICTNCSGVWDIEGEFMKRMEEEVHKNKKFKVKNHSLEFFGICKNCQS